MGWRLFRINVAEGNAAGSIPDLISVSYSELAMRASTLPSLSRTAEGEHE